MRELKFRAWHKENKAMYDSDITMATILSRWPTNTMNVREDYELMQYTWLKDKNWKGIYEGDILRYCEKNKQIYLVKYWNYNRNDGLKNIAPQLIGASFYLEGIDTTISPVYTYNDHAFLFPVSGDFPSTFERYKELWGLEIIGNIYENPELLTN